MLQIEKMDYLKKDILERFSNFIFGSRTISGINQFEGTYFHFEISLWGYITSNSCLSVRYTTRLNCQDATKCSVIESRILYSELSQVENQIHRLIACAPSTDRKTFNYSHHKGHGLHKVGLYEFDRPIWGILQTRLAVGQTPLPDWILDCSPCRVQNSIRFHIIARTVHLIGNVLT